jgi:hypothetical protein
MKQEIMLSAVFAIACCVWALAPLRAEAGPPDWSVNPAEFDYDGSVTAAVFVDTVQIGSAGDLVGAFVGGQCRGVADGWETPLSTYIFLLTVYSNAASGEFLNFKYYDSALDQVRDVVETIEFQPDMTVGSMINPFSMHILNHPPNEPTEPEPADSTEDVGLGADLGWTGGDPDIGDTVIYYIYFGNDPDPACHDTTECYPASTTDLSYDLPSLDYSTTYYWRIVAEDNHGAASPGTTWYFVTQDENPVEPTTWGSIKTLFE